MKRRTKIISTFIVLGVAALGLVFFVGLNVEDRPAITALGNAERGAVLMQTAGCYACHTQADGSKGEYAGGSALVSPFGNFFAPNITSSKEHGIGDWDIVTFERALRQGVNPEGQSYYPAFPYMSYRSLTDQDVADLFAALKNVAAVEQDHQPHEVGFPFNIRLGLKPWRWLFSTVRPLNIDQSTPVGRGRYLVDAVAHCGECHTPRNSLGAPIPPYLGGASLNDDWAPPITARAYQHMDWSKEDLIYFLEDGMLPDGDFIGGSMVEVIEHGTSKMPYEDRAAIAEYLFSLVQR